MISVKYTYYNDVVLFQGGYPAKLKKVLIVTAPLWFKAPFKILRLFVREKLRDRVFTVSIPQLTLHIPRESLPHRLGGTLEIQHEAWLLHCLKSMTNRGGGELCEVGSTDDFYLTYFIHRRNHRETFMFAGYPQSGYSSFAHVEKSHGSSKSQWNYSQ